MEIFWFRTVAEGSQPVTVYGAACIAVAWLSRWSSSSSVEEVAVVAAAGVGEGGRRTSSRLAPLCVICHSVAAPR